ncbi:CPCC family cysteine-rich protein [Gallaecimonas xiamenensis]|uniref:Cysteine-rich CPCC domain-containing protein n=1 Tax=Gallaecimonas xiamenensis 3-C-1 TaxID=745411 RepID=K2J3Z4_9GAMM|nr:CPCC family cysteine-rich protein [Gallaecimonas xiamenensis]EKE69592.1 hypothetical protein B3C1_14902 [Gallaecimonas xiamenensis 3-C-1]
MADPDWYSPADARPRLQCPCCDYVTLPERGRYLICPVCFWEDEGLDLDTPDEVSTANHCLTLRQARYNFQLFGACETDMMVHVLPVDEREQFRCRPRRLPKRQD